MHSAGSRTLAADRSVYALWPLATGCHTIDYHDITSASSADFDALDLTKGSQITAQVHKGHLSTYAHAQAHHVFHLCLKNSGCLTSPMAVSGQGSFMTTFGDPVSGHTFHYL